VASVLTQGKTLNGIKWDFSVFNYAVAKTSSDSEDVWRESTV